jgi:uncharacterized delta-60 repeat protein
MKGKILALFFLINFTSLLSLNAQWARTYGTSEDECAYSIQQTSDGGYIVAGKTGEYEFYEGRAIPPAEDIWILKLSSDGTIEWQKTYGGGSGDFAYSIQQTNDGGYIVGGRITITGWGRDIWVLKLFSDGTIEWQKSYGDRNAEEAYFIQQTSDGGYIVVGQTFSSWGTLEYDIFVLKLFSDGTIEWNKTYGGSEDDQAYSIQQTNDGGYLVAGYTESFGAGVVDSWILKLSSVGDIEWQRTYGLGGGDRAYSIQQTNDGGYIVAGLGSGDILVLKLDSDGTIEWQKTYGGPLWDEAHSIQKTNDGGYIVAGYTESFGAGNGDIWVLKLTSDGTIEWQKTYGGYNGDEAHTIHQTSDGGYIVAGSTDSYGAGERDFLVLKLSSNGDIDPACGFIRESNAEVSDTDIIPANTDITLEDTNITPGDTNITPQESKAVVYSLCSGQHTLSLSAGSGGTTVPQPGTYIYDHASRISISADPDDGYDFSEWSGDVSGTDSWRSITMDSDKSINANFSIIVTDDVWEEVKKTPCFIATAAYGSPHHPYVRILRDFRDKFLMSKKFGRTLVKTYYKYSPFLANFIAEHKALKVAVRVSLFPLVVFSYSMVHFGPIFTAGVLVFFSCFQSSLSCFIERN